MDHIARILLVEDEENIRETLSLNLELEGYEVVGLADGKSVLPQFLGQHFDLVLLDIMLPEMDGLDVCEQIRLHDSEIPIIFLTAKDNSADKIQGLRKGADDYITKPFMLEELLLRIQILLKRSQNHRANTLDEYHFGPNYVNFKEQSAKGQDGQSFKLTKKEGMLLKLLIERANESVSRQQILQAVWGYDVYPSTRTIDNFILSFRKYFEEDPKNPQFFLSVRGVGYKFQAEKA